jgi:hypothetical protein
MSDRRRGRVYPSWIRSSEWGVLSGLRPSKADSVRRETLRMRPPEKNKITRGGKAMHVETHPVGKVAEVIFIDIIDGVNMARVLGDAAETFECAFCGAEHNLLARRPH